MHLKLERDQEAYAVPFVEVDRLSDDSRLGLYCPVLLEDSAVDC